jgi:hypothetical protein
MAMEHGTRGGGAAHSWVGEIDATLLLHLGAVGGEATHEALLVWARQLGYGDEDLDRCLVRACHAGAIAIDLGDPPCTATRVAHLTRR